MFKKPKKIERFLKDSYNGDIYFILFEKISKEKLFAGIKGRSAGKQKFSTYIFVVFNKQDKFKQLLWNSYNSVDEDIYPPSAFPCNFDEALKIINKGYLIKINKKDIEKSIAYCQKELKKIRNDFENKYIKAEKIYSEIIDKLLENPFNVPDLDSQIALFQESIRLSGICLQGEWIKKYKDPVPYYKLLRDYSIQNERNNLLNQEKEEKIKKIIKELKKLKIR